jgi:cyclase
VTSIDRDGTRSGFDLDLIRSVAAATRVPVIASGGARVARDFAEAFAAGATGALAASIFHDGDTRLDELRLELLALGVGLRPLADTTSAPTGEPS